MSSEASEEALLFVERDMRAGELFAFAGGRAGVFSAKSPEKDTVNEDCAALIPLGPERGVLVVADGLGGMRGGAVASSVALHELVEALEERARAGGDGELRGAILDAIESANREIHTLGVGAGTTLVVAEVRGASVRPYHVGDSMILAVGQRGRVKLQTIPHSPVGYAVESGLLDEVAAMHHEDRHLVSNVLGSPDMRIEVGSPLVLAPRDTLLLASDGLYDNLHVDEIVALVRKGSLDDAVGALASLARERMQSASNGAPHKPDDLTLIAFRPGARLAERAG
jgi:serine/threonine protein phosphatase PrpC